MPKPEREFSFPDDLPSMAQQDERTQQTLAYIRHQASKSLADLRVVVERTAADCGRCLESISEAQARFKPGNEWSVKEVLNHLIYATAQQITERMRDFARFETRSVGGRGGAAGTSGDLTVLTMWR